MCVCVCSGLLVVEMCGGQSCWGGNGLFVWACELRREIKITLKIRLLLQ